MMHVAFVNENALGHGSYLLPFVRALEEGPELGIVPHRIDATPLPPSLARWGDASVKGLRRWGLDFHPARWRRAASLHARRQLDALRRRQRIDAVVVNTQSVGLEMVETAADLPVLVCLDATFEELSRTGWFAPNGGSRALLPLTLAPIRGRERALLAAARALLAWSEPVARSLVEDYGIDAARVHRLPPSLALPPAGRARRRAPGRRPQVLFLGGDFRRKGGPLLLECWREHLRDRCDLHLVTRSPVSPEPGVHVHRDVAAHTPAWRERWEEADVFVFPSALETFGIVLLEALAFGVPVVASDVGAARDVLADGRAGILLPRPDRDSLAAAIAAVLDDPEAARARSEAG
ncbi:MAG TPA: glycosyltransferase family 4 protein, partial [Longimicrobiaceae bacterium]|nr:glycosyltransferase family 4 protein [Longimicrobiaceae bacterium]